MIHAQTVGCRGEGWQSLSVRAANSNNAMAQSVRAM